VLDVDRQRGDAALAQLERRHGPLPATARFIAGDSEQLVFAHPRRPIRTAVKRIAAGIKVLADGQFVVAPPSLSADGRRGYVYPADGLLIAALPLWLVGRICEPQRFPIPPELPEVLQRLYREGAFGERRNWCVTSLSELLLRNGVDAYSTLLFALALNTAHSKPPLPDAEVVALVEDAFDQFPAQHRRGLLQRAAAQFGEPPRWPQALLGGGVASHRNPHYPGRDASNMPSALATEMPEDANEASQDEGSDADDGLLLGEGRS
jgi:hypothetical protein